jgi:hypothetical protein
MRLTLRDRNSVPPGGEFFLFDPDTKVRISEQSWNGLMVAWTMHRMANHLSMPIDSDGLMDDLVCQELVKKGFPERCVFGQADFVPVKKTIRQTLEDLRRGTRTIWLAMKSDTVPHEEAERRATICVSCPANMFAASCAPCQWRELQDFIRTLIGNNLSTTRDPELKSCYYCGCFNAAQVHVPVDVLQKFLPAEIDEQLPDFCWKKSTNNPKKEH